MTSRTDFSTLGRLGTASGRHVRRRRPARRAPVHRGPTALARVPWPLVAGAAAIAVALIVVVVGLTAGAQTGTVSAVLATAPHMDPALERELRTDGAATVATGSISLLPGGGDAMGTITAPPAFAAVEDVALHLPLAVAADVVFLEADNPAALPLVPVGHMRRNGNPAGFEPTTRLEGPAFTVAPPISGARPATGMAAVLAAPGDAVHAPVQGVVTSVEAYEGADGQEDWRIGIQPAERPDLQVVVRRIEAPLVAVGQEVTVGSTALGAVRDGAVISAAANPDGLPSALLHVRPATGQEAAGVLAGG